MPNFPLWTNNVGPLRDLSFSYSKDLCDYNNTLIRYKECLYCCKDQNVMYRRLHLNYYMTILKNYEIVFKRKKDQFICLFLAEFRDFDNSLHTLKTIKDLEYEKYKLESLRRVIHTFYLSNSDVGGLAIDCLDFLDNMILLLLRKIMEKKKFNRIVESNNCFNCLNVKYEIENRALDKGEVRIFTSKEMVREFEINEYW